MGKKEAEFFDIEKVTWSPVKGVLGIQEKILSFDEKTGVYTRMLLFDPGAETYETLTHDFSEEVYIVKGSLRDKQKGLDFKEGMYACRSPGMRHGPYYSRTGCLLFEVRYYQKRARCVNRIRSGRRNKK